MDAVIVDKKRRAGLGWGGVVEFGEKGEKYLKKIFGENPLNSSLGLEPSDMLAVFRYSTESI